MREKLISSYRVCGEFDLTDALLDFRIAAINKIYSEETNDFLVRCLAFFMLGIYDNEHKECLIKYFKDEDTLFLTEDNDTELRLLCGVILYNEVVENENESASVVIGTILKTLSFARSLEFLNKGILEDITESCEKAILRMRILKKTTVSKNAEIEKTITSLISAVSSLTYNQNILAEESNIHWWLKSGYSELKNKYFNEFSLFELSILGEELAKLTLLESPLSNAQSFLKEIFRETSTDEKISFSSFINEYGGKIQSPLTEDFLLYCPLLTAIKIYNETETKDSFVKKVKDKMYVDSTILYSPIEFALELYYEFMIYKLL